MLMRALGKSKWAALGGWMLAIYLGLSIPGAGFAGEAPVTQATAPPASGESEIIFNAKLFCSLKRHVDLPFKGIITSLRAHSGQRVEKGEILATYRLAPEDADGDSTASRTAANFRNGDETVGNGAHSGPHGE